MTFVKPPLPASVRLEGATYGEALANIVQARDAEMLRAVADWLQQRAGQLRISEGALVLAECSTALRKAAEQ